jgi:UDPglucose 6-dehydrogenase
LAEGTAINDLEKPDRVLIGGEDSDSIDALVKIYLNWVPYEQIICTNLWSSELSKLAANAFLAQRISSINSISAFCEATGADVQEVAKAIGTDKRIGNQFLSAGPGFGGSCFKKDILNLVYLSGYFGLPEVANYWNQVVVLNTWQQDRIYKIVLEKLFGTVNGKNIAILGFSFKANTNDTRESPAIRISSDLLEEGAILSIYDPKVTFERIEEDFEKFSFNNHGIWKMASSIPEALKNVDAVIILTAWDEFYGLDWNYLASLMRSPAWVFDTRSVVNRQEVEDTGVNLWKLGEGN